MAKSTVDSIFDDKDILNEAVEQFKSLFIEVQQIIIFRQLSKIPQYLSKLEHFNQQYSEIYQRKSDISSSIMHFHTFNDAIKNLYLPQVPEHTINLYPIDNFLTLLKQAQNIIYDKKFDLAEQYLHQVKIFQEQHGELIKFIFKTYDHTILNAFNDFTNFIQDYQLLLGQTTSNDNLIANYDTHTEQFLNEHYSHLQEKIIMIEAKGLRKLKKLSVVQSSTPFKEEHSDNPQDKIVPLDSLSEKSAHNQTIVKSIDYIEPQCTATDQIGKPKSDNYVDIFNDLEIGDCITHHSSNASSTDSSCLITNTDFVNYTTNNINQITPNVDDNSPKSIEPQILDTDNQTGIDVVTEPTIGNKIHVIMSSTPQELDMENCVDWIIEPENPNSPTILINEVVTEPQILDTDNQTGIDVVTEPTIITEVNLLAENINDNTNSG